MEKIFSKTYYLGAGECGPEQALPVAKAVDRCIEVATDHANLIGVGYGDLRPHGQSWVLSRIVVEMERYPRANTNYTVETWVESFSRAFSMRNFRFLDGEGRVCGYARSVWAAIDVEKRTMADLGWAAEICADVPTDRECPIPPVGRHRPVAGEGVERVGHEFRYSDLDSNRHVNSVRYVEMLMDCWPLEFHDANFVSRLEVSFTKECYYGEKAEVVLLRAPEGPSEADIAVDGAPRVHFSVSFSGR